MSNWGYWAVTQLRLSEGDVTLVVQDGANFLSFKEPMPKAALPLIKQMHLRQSEVVE